MKVDRKLNLIIPFAREDGSSIHVFASPLGRAIYQIYYLPLAKTLSMMIEQEILLVGGATVARSMLEDISRNTPRAGGASNWWEGVDGVENGLLGELRRLTSVLAPKASGGWETLMFEEAVKVDLFTEDEVAEVENAQVFFTLVSRMLKGERSEGPRVIAERMFGWRTSSSSMSEFRNSLSTSTQVASSGAKAKALSTIR
jgi:hypothetical protein